MNSMNIEIERIKKKFFIQRILNEINDIKETNDKYETDPVYVERMDIYKKITQENTESLNQILTTASENVYAKKWNKLPDYHKIQKIKEYINVKYEDEPEKKEEIEELLIEKVKSGDLNSCKFVDYDNTTYKINKITIAKKNY